MNPYKRQKDLSCEERVWNYLTREKRAVRVKEITQHFNFDLQRTSKACLRLLAKGCVVAAGNTNNRTYQATPTPPSDFRGLTDGSRLALQRCNERRHADYLVRNPPPPLIMTHAERLKLIETMTLQLYHAKRNRRGVSMSHQLVEQLVNELKLLQRLERDRVQTVPPSPVPPVSVGADLSPD